MDDSCLNYFPGELQNGDLSNSVVSWHRGSEDGDE